MPCIQRSAGQNQDHFSAPLAPFWLSACCLPRRPFAAHMASYEVGEDVDEASVSTLESRKREAPELEEDAGANPDPLRAKASNAADRPIRTSTLKENGNLPAHDFPRRGTITDSVVDVLGLAGPDVASQPEESATMNARIPGLSHDTLARFKKRMYRKDI